VARWGEAAARARWRVGGNGGGDDPIACGQLARAAGHVARSSQQEFETEHDEDNEGLDGMGSRDARLRLVGGTASGSQLHVLTVLTLDSGASASSCAAALRETQGCFDGGLSTAAI